jgi:hypothetical protein
MEGNRIPKRVLYMNLGTTRLRDRPRNRRQDEVREDGRIVGGKEWKERVYNREERKKLLRTARIRRILQMPTGRMNERTNKDNTQKQTLCWYIMRLKAFKLRIKSHLPLACIIRSSPYSPR